MLNEIRPRTVSIIERLTAPETDFGYLLCNLQRPIRKYYTPLNSQDYILNVNQLLTVY